MNLFIKNYLNPIISEAKMRFNLCSDELEKKIKACIIMRLLGVYNIWLMEPIDQAKVLALLFKTIATPIKRTGQSSVLTRLKKTL